MSIALFSFFFQLIFITWLALVHINKLDILWYVSKWSALIFSVIFITFQQIQVTTAGTSTACCVDRSFARPRWASKRSDSFSNMLELDPCCNKSSTAWQSCFFFHKANVELKKYTLIHWWISYSQQICKNYWRPFILASVFHCDELDEDIRIFPILY